MIEIGKRNKLNILRKAEVGLYLDGQEDGPILLPRQELANLPEDAQVLDVFIYRDSEDRLTATLKSPKASIGDFAKLRVLSIEKVGAFLDWGLSKDLLLPFAEQTHQFKPDDELVVYLYLDKSDRIAASMRLEKNIQKDSYTFSTGEEVQLIIVDRSELGYKALINNKALGLIFKNEVFQPLKYGMEIKGYIKTLREDGKIDLSLQRIGHKAGQDIAPMIIEMLQKNGGFLEINSKTSAETIHHMFGVSRKKFKIALGGLYKNHQVSIGEEGIRLLKVKPD